MSRTTFPHAPSRQSSSRRRLRASLPTLEALESRCLLAVTIQEFPIPTPASHPFGMTAGADGNLWFTESAADKIGRITPAGIVTEFPLPVGSQPEAITKGPDGNIWFVEAGLSEVGRITPAGVLSQFLLLNAGTNVEAITTGADGNLWVSEGPTNLIARMTPAGFVTLFQAFANGVPVGITAGPGGNLWYAASNAPTIARITPAGTATEFTTLNTAAGFIAAGPDGNLWSPAIEFAQRIDRITPNGVPTSFPTPGVNEFSDVTGGPDGNIWFTDSFDNKIGFITSLGAVSTFAIPSPVSNPQGIAAGPDGNVWFVEDNGNKIGRAVLSSPPNPHNATFVTNLYADLLGRAPDAGGLASWTAQLNLGVSRSQVVLGFEASPEYHGIVVAQFYNNLFHRNVDPLGLNSWTAFLAAGGSVEQLEANLLGSAEYFGLHGNNNTGFLQRAYQDVFGRAIDAGGASFWGGLLASGAPRAAIALDLVQSLEGDTDAVQMIYLHFLRRQADPFGLQVWTGELQAGVDLEVVQAAILSSDEYFNRS